MIDRRVVSGFAAVLLLLALIVIFFPHAARGEAVQSGRGFACTPVAVWDGDGPIWCAEGPRIRLAGIAAREMDGSCRTGQPCPAASAVSARDALVGLLGRPAGRRPEGHIVVRGPAMACLSDGSAGGSRTAAWCRLADGRDLSCAMIGTRTVLRWASFDRARRLVAC